MLHLVNNSGFSIFQSYVLKISLILFVINSGFTVNLYALDDFQNLNPQDTKKLLKQAKKLQRKGKYRDAEKILRKVIALQPQYTKAKLALAYLLLKRKKLIESSNLAVDVASKDKNNAYAFAILGATHLSAGNFNQARIFLNNSLALSKSEPLAWAGLGMLNFYENRTETSLENLRIAVYQDRDEPDFIFALGQVAARTEQYKEAAKAYQRFLEIAPNSDLERKERIKGLIGFLNYLGKKTTLYGLSGEKETSVPIQLVENRPVIELKFSKNGESLRFVLDTGSGMTVISQETAKRLKIKQVAKGGEARALGGDGKFDIVYGFLNNVYIGDIRVRNVPIYIRKFHTKKNRVDGYIGISLISKYVTTIDYGSKTFSLLRKEEYQKRQPPNHLDSMTVPLRLTSSGFLSGQVKLEGIERPLNFIVDTGASVSVISEEIADTKVIQKHLLERKMDVIGAAGITEDVPLFSLPNVSLGKYSRKSLMAIALNLNQINEASGFDQAGILGGNFLRDYRLTFDFDKSKVTVVPNKN